MNTALKACLASAALVSSVVVAVDAPAVAGDLGRGNYSTKDFGYVAPRAAAGPCYFRGDVGYSGSRDPSVSWPVNSITRTYDTSPSTYGSDNSLHPTYGGTLVSETTTFVGSGVSNVEIENSWFGEVGVGCGQGSRGFRAEAVVGFRGNRKIDGEPENFNVTEIYNDAIDPDQVVVDNDPLHSDLSTYTFMINVYRDLGKWGSFVPYVGVGAGVAYHRMGETYFTDNPYLVNRIEGNNDLSFAWSLMAGFGYQLTDRAILDVGYRYIDMGKIKSGRADSAGFVNPAVVVDDITAHEIKVGLRYHFGSSSPVVTEYAPMK